MWGPYGTCRPDYPRLGRGVLDPPQSYRSSPRTVGLTYLGLSRSPSVPTPVGESERHRPPLFSPRSRTSRCQVSCNRLASCQASVRGSNRSATEADSIPTCTVTDHAGRVELIEADPIEDDGSGWSWWTVVVVMNEPRWVCLQRVRACAMGLDSPRSQ